MGGLGWGFLLNASTPTTQPKRVVGVLFFGKPLTLNLAAGRALNLNTRTLLNTREASQVKAEGSNGPRRPRTAVSRLVLHWMKRRRHCGGVVTGSMGWYTPAGRVSTRAVKALMVIHP